MNWSITPKSLFILFLFLSLIIIGGVNAITIKFQDASMAGPQNIDVYSTVNGTHLYSGNTTSLFNVDESVIIHISPDRVDYIRNPSAFINELVSWISDNLVAIIILCLAVGILLRR